MTVGTTLITMIGTTMTPGTTEPAQIRYEWKHQLSPQESSGTRLPV